MITEAIEQARTEGATELEALARFAPDWHRSTNHGRRRRYRAGEKFQAKPARAG